MKKAAHLIKVQNDKRRVEMQLGFVASTSSQTPRLLLNSNSFGGEASGGISPVQLSVGCWALMKNDLRWAVIKTKPCDIPVNPVWFKTGSLQWLIITPITPILAPFPFQWLQLRACAAEKPHSWQTDEWGTGLGPDSTSFYTPATFVFGIRPTASNSAEKSIYMLVYRPAKLSKDWQKSRTWHAHLCRRLDHRCHSTNHPTSACYWS